MLHADTEWTILATHRTYFFPIAASSVDRPGRKQEYKLPTIDDALVRIGSTRPQHALFLPEFCLPAGVDPDLRRYQAYVFSRGQRTASMRDSPDVIFGAFGSLIGGKRVIIDGPGDQITMLQDYLEKRLEIRIPIIDN